SLLNFPENVSDLYSGLSGSDRCAGMRKSVRLDNGTFVVQSFRAEPAMMSISTAGAQGARVRGLRDREVPAAGVQPPPALVRGRGAGAGAGGGRGGARDAVRVSFKVQVPPHGCAVFAAQ